MDVFSIASEVLGDLKLSSGQLGQLRALDYRLLLERHRRSRDGEAAGAGGDAPAAAPAGADDVPKEDLAQLRADVVAEILEMLTPEQRASLDLH